MPKTPAADLAEPELVDAPVSPPSKTVDAWAAEKGVQPWALEGAVGMRRAARAWALHERPVVTEAEFDAAVAAFTNVSLG